MLDDEIMTLENKYVKIIEMKEYEADHPNIEKVWSGTCENI